MRLRILLQAILLAFTLTLFGGALHAQNHVGGIKKVSEQNHLTTYTVRLVELSDETAARRLENGLLEKEGFVSANANFNENLVTLVVKPGIEPKLIGEVIDFWGFTVAKSFED